MDLINREHNNGIFTLEFAEETSDRTYKTKMSFEERWRYNVTDDLENELGESIGAYNMFPSFRFSDTEKMTDGFFNVIAVYIPHSLGRKFFSNMVNYYTTVANAPIQVKRAENPGPPMMHMIYNSFIVKQSFVQELIDKVMKSIKQSKLTVIEKEVEPLEEEGDALDAEDWNVVEYDLEEELKGMMHNPADNKIDTLQEDKEEEDD